MIDFDDEFASPADYARLYRSIGMQVVPANFPHEVREWKRPHFDLKWKQYQHALMNDEEFNGLFGPGSKYAGRQNMGIITGVSPRRIVVIDLDTHKSPKAQQWWDRIHAEHAYGIMTETVAQRTGGGGYQYFFLAPEGWACPTNKNPLLGVDSRGDGGFVMIAPSLHESGKNYEWIEGCAPWEIEIEVMPKWMRHEVEAILGVGTSHTGDGDRVKTSAPEYQVDPFGGVVDGREGLMARIVFRAVLDLYRGNPESPGIDAQAMAKEIAFRGYLDAVETRLGGPAAGKEAALEREGRGRSLFEKKWSSAMRQWNDKISVEAARPFVKPEPERIDPFAEPPPASGLILPEKKIIIEDPDFAPKKKLLKLYTMDEVEALGPVQALIQDLVAESSLGFIYGAPGCGKTFVALSMGLSLAYGFDHWFWDKKILRPGPVIYISLEGKADIGNRLKAWKIFNGISHNDDQFRLILDEVNFLSDESIKLFVDSVDDYMSAKKAPVMIFIDTISRAIAGGAENDQKEISKFIQTCDRLKSRYNTNMTGIHHSGRMGDHMRGSTVLDGGADYMFRVERKKENGLNGIFYAEKIKAYPDKWEMPFRLAKVDLDAFGSQSSLVATSKEDPLAKAQEEDFGGNQETGKEPDMDTCKRMVEAIDAAWRGGYPWSKTKSPGSDRVAAERLSDSFNYSIEVCQKYVNIWHRNDVIVTDIWGDKGQKRGLRRGKGL
jgi:hypothetical protein